MSGPGRLLREAWERYRLPLVVTEAQLNCTREEQMRWFAEIWRDADTLRRHEGVDVRAVTLWALLGAFNWTNLLTRDDPDGYEPGAFDLRAPEPRPTALATLARTLARDGDTDHPVLRVPGWWKRPERFACEPADAHQPLAPAIFQKEGSADPASCPLLIIGRDRALVQAFNVICRERALTVEFLDPCRLAGSEPTAVRDLLASIAPWAVVYSPEEAKEPNGNSDGRIGRQEVGITSRLLAQVCAERDISLLIFSSDHRINAKDPDLADKNDLPSAAATQPVEPTVVDPFVAARPEALSVFTDVRFGPWDEDDLVLTAVRALTVGKMSGLPTDRPFTLSYLPDLVQTSLDLLLDGATGAWNLSNTGTLDQRMFNAYASQVVSHVLGTHNGEASVPLPSLRSTLAVEQPAALLPSWQTAVKHLIHGHKF